MVSSRIPLLCIKALKTRASESVEITDMAMGMSIQKRVMIKNVGRIFLEIK
jgi:hypothetical protein